MRMCARALIWPACSRLQRGKRANVSAGTSLTPLVFRSSTDGIEPWKNVQFLRSYCCKMWNSDMAVVRKCFAAVSLMATAGEPLEARI